MIILVKIRLCRFYVCIYGGDDKINSGSDSVIVSSRLTGHLCPAILITPPGSSQQITAAGLKALALDPTWLTKHPLGCPRAKRVQSHGQPSQKRQHVHDSGLHARPAAPEPKWPMLSPSGLPQCQRLRPTKLRPRNPR